jgi:tetratricopeptide (TPR) repeat protein
MNFDNAVQLFKHLESPSFILALVIIVGAFASIKLGWLPRPSKKTIDDSIKYIILGALLLALSGLIKELANSAYGIVIFILSFIGFLTHKFYSHKIPGLRESFAEKSIIENKSDTASHRKQYPLIVREPAATPHKHDIADSFSEKYNTSLDIVMQSMSCYREVVFDRENIQTWNKLALVTKELGKLEDAKKAYISAINLPNAMENPAQLSSAYLNLGDIYRIQKEYNKSELMTLRSITINTILGNDFELSIGYCNLGRILYCSKKITQAKFMFEKCIELSQDNEKTNKYNAISYYGLGLIHIKLENYPDARNCLETSLEISELSGLNQEKIISALKHISGKFI